jgi:hypothetical protein
MESIKTLIAALACVAILITGGCITADPVDGDLEEGSYGEEGIRHLTIREDGSGLLIESCRSAGIEGPIVADGGELELHFSFYSDLPVQGEEEPIGAFTLQATVLGGTIQGVYFPDEDPSSTTEVFLVLDAPGVANTCQ